MLKYIIRIPVVIMLYIFFLVILSLPNDGNAIFTGLPPSQIAGEINQMMLGKWMCVICPPLLVNGLLLERSQKIEIFSLLRMEKLVHSRLRILGSCFILTLLWAIGIFGASVLCFDIKTATQILILLAPNLLLWTSVGLSSCILTDRAVWSGILPLAGLGTSCLLGAYFPAWLRYLPSTWGMRCYFVGLGDSLLMCAAVLLSLLFTAICSMLFVFYKK